MLATLATILPPIRDSAASIESAFLRAGDGLSRGLGSFETLKSNMSGLGDQLSRNGMDAAVASLGRVSHELAAIGDGLPGDRAILEDLVGRDKQVSAQIGTLIENMRMMTILARSARIEAVVFDRQGDGFVDFTQEIMALTRNVQSDIERCARDHRGLSELLGAALAAQISLERSHRAKLRELAREFVDSAATIARRRDTGAELMGEVGRRADGIASATRTAIMSLQAGDSTRQRLEHVHHGLSVALGDDGTPPTDERLAMIAAMCRLQRAQLADAVACFDRDVASIDGALQLLGRDTQDIVSLGRGIYGDGSQGSSSFLAAIKERLAKAAEHIGSCEAGRATVRETVAGLCTRIDALSGAVSALARVVPEIVLIGLNAGLKAGRLGAAGRSVVVIAHELNELAIAIQDSTNRLRPMFCDLQEMSGRLHDAPAAEDAPQGGLDEDMRIVVAALDAGSAALGSFLATLAAEAQTFEADLDRARQDFAATAAANLDLLRSADILDDLDHHPAAQALDLDAAIAQVDAQVGSSYTMAREREIHAAILGQAGRPPGAETFRRARA